MQYICSTVDSHRTFDFYTEVASFKSAQLALLKFAFLPFFFVYFYYFLSFVSYQKYQPCRCCFLFGRRFKMCTEDNLYCQKFSWLSSVSAAKYRGSIANWVTITSSHILLVPLFNNHPIIRCSTI